MNKAKGILLRALAALALLGAAPLSMAGSDVSWSVTIGSSYPAARVYSPPPVVYVQPQPIYVHPRPVHVRPAAVVRHGPPPHAAKHRHMHGPVHHRHPHRHHH